MPIEFEQHIYLNFVITTGNVSMEIIDPCGGKVLASSESVIIDTVYNTMECVAESVMAQLLDVAKSNKNIIKLQTTHENRKH